MEDQARQGKEGHGRWGENPTISLVWLSESGSLAVGSLAIGNPAGWLSGSWQSGYWQSRCLAVWQSGTCSLTASLAAIRTSLQCLAAVPSRPAREMLRLRLRRFRTAGAFLSSPRIAQVTRCCPRGSTQTPPSALCTLHSAFCTLQRSASLLLAAPSAIYRSLPSSLVWDLDRNRGRSTLQPAQNESKGFPKDRVNRANDTWQGKASD